MDDFEYDAWKALETAGRRNRLESWLQEGGNPNAWFPSRRMTPLRLAARLGKKRGVHVLLAAGANPATAANGGVNLLHEALGDTADDFFDGDTWARMKLADAPVEVIRMLVEAGVPVDAPGLRDRTPLWRLCARTAVSFESRAATAAILLIQSGADVNSKDAEGVSPLHLVAGALPDSETTANAHRLISSLLSAGAKMEARDHQGLTPLLCTIRRENPEVLQLLIASGATATVVDPSGKTGYHRLATALRPSDNLRRALHNRMKCVTVLLNAGVPIPSGIQGDSRIARGLVYLHDHRSDDAEPPSSRNVLATVLPFLHRSEKWWLNFFSAGDAFHFRDAILANPTCPNHLKDLFSVSLA